MCSLVVQGVHYGGDDMQMDIELTLDTIVIIRIGILSGHGGLVAMAPAPLLWDGAARCMCPPPALRLHHLSVVRSLCSCVSRRGAG